MALTDGPLIFPTDGANASPAGLSTVRSFATATHWRLMVMDKLHISEMPDGVLALLSAPRRFGGHLWGDASYQTLIRDWHAPIVMLPAKDTTRPLRRVLFPADLAARSNAALDEAVALCSTLGAELHILHVFGDDRRLPSEIDHAHRATARSPRELFDMDRALVQDLVERASSRGVQASAHILEGRAHTQILHYTSENQIDLVLMPTHGPRTLEDIMLGTTTARVMQHISVPVIALRSSPPHPGVSRSA